MRAVGLDTLQVQVAFPTWAPTSCSVSTGSMRIHKQSSGETRELTGGRTLMGGTTEGW